MPSAAQLGSSGVKLHRCAYLSGSIAAAAASLVMQPHQLMAG